MGLAKAPSWLPSRERDHGRYVFWPTIGRRPALRFLGGRHTCYGWSKLPEFRKLVSEHRSRLIESTLGSLIKGSTAAAEKIVELVEKAESQTVQLAACKAVLDHLTAFHDFAALREQVESLKAEIENMKGTTLAIHPQSA